MRAEAYFPCIRTFHASIRALQNESRCHAHMHCKMGLNTMLNGRVEFGNVQNAHAPQHALLVLKAGRFI